MGDPLRLQKLWLRVVGVTFYGDIKKKWLRSLVDIYFSFNMFVGLLWAFLYFRGAYLYTFKNFNIRVSGIQGAVSALPAVSKYLSFRLKGDTVRVIFEALGTFEIPDKRDKTIRKLCNVFIALIVIIVVNTLVVPFLGDEFRRSTPYYSEEETGPFDEVLVDVIIIAYGAAVVVWGNGIVDSLFLILASQLCYKVYILKNTFTFIGKPWDPNAKDVLDIPLHVTDEELQKICVEEHKRLLKLKEQLNSLYQDVLTVQLLASLVDVCISLFLMSQIQDFVKDVDKVKNVAPALFALYLQIFFYCWGGEMLNNHFEQLYDTLYSTLWYTCSKEVKSSLIIMLAYMKRPVYISTFVFHFNFSMYESICREAFSYYTLMRQLFK